MKKHISLITLIFLILGIIFGLCFSDMTSSIAFIGTYYINILKFMMAPVIFTSISYTIYKTNKKNNSDITLKAILVFILMYVCTFLLTSLIVYFINPASSFTLIDETWNGTTTSFDIKDILVNWIPKNLNDIFISPKVFGIIVFAFLFGIVGSFVPKSEKLFELINKLKEYLFKLLEIIMYLTPFATFALISNTVANFGMKLLGVGIKYIGVAYSCSVLTLILIMILPCKIFANKSPLEYIKKASKIWLITFSTCSSAATLPFTVKVCKEEFNINEDVTDVVVPLGCTIHMCGGAVSFALLGLFCAKLYGIEINFLTFMLMLISSLLINMSAPGIPNGGVVIGATYLEMFGIPLGFIGFYSGIYKLLDMVYTTLNVTGDITANILIDNKKNG